MMKARLVILLAFVSSQAYACAFAALMQSRCRKPNASLASSRPRGGSFFGNGRKGVAALADDGVQLRVRKFESPAQHPDLNLVPQIEGVTKHRGLAVLHGRSPSSEHCAPADMRTERDGLGSATTRF